FEVLLVGEAGKLGFPLAAERPLFEVPLAAERPLLEVLLPRQSILFEVLLAAEGPLLEVPPPREHCQLCFSLGLELGQPRFPLLAQLLLLGLVPIEGRL